MLKAVVERGADGVFQLLCSNCHTIKTYEEVWKNASWRAWGNE